jgi:hypothetical protein
MPNAWDVRPKRDKGDNTPEPLYLKVGEALTSWEALESIMAELFDVMVSVQPSNRAAFCAFTAVRSSSARTQLLEAAADKAVPKRDPARNDVNAAIKAFGEFGARRNEIAHGRVYGLGEHGFYLAPNNVMPHKWTDEGQAKYQYVADDLAYYASCFIRLEDAACRIVTALRSRASFSTNRTRSRQDERRKRT